MKIAFTKDFVHHISISGLPVGKYSSRKEEQLNVHEYILSPNAETHPQSLATTIKCDKELRWKLRDHRE